jgi:hypothetical protein
MVRAALAHPWRRGAIALLAAYGLALQALLSGLGGALHPAPAGVAPLCAPEDGAAGPKRGAPAPHAELCCVLACHASALGEAAVAPATAGSLQLIGAISADREVAFELAARKLRPVGSRAPPIAA